MMNPIPVWNFPTFLINIAFVNPFRYINNYRTCIAQLFKYTMMLFAIALINFKMPSSDSAHSNSQKTLFSKMFQCPDIMPTSMEPLHTES